MTEVPCERNGSRRGSDRRSARRRWSLVGALLVAVLGGQEVAAAEFSDFLVGRIALLRNDFPVAADRFEQVVERKPDWSDVREQALLARLAAGDVPAAEPHAKRLMEEGLPSWMVDLVLYAEFMIEEEFAEAEAALKSRSEAWAGPLRAWARVGIGDIEGAREQLRRGLEDASQTEKFHASSRYQLGLLELEYGDEQAGMRELLEVIGKGGDVRPILAAGLRMDDAAMRTLYLEAIHAGARLPILRRAIRASLDGAVLGRAVASPSEGAAEALLEAAAYFEQDSRGAESLLILQLADRLRPGDVFVIDSLRRSLSWAGLYEQALLAVRAIPDDVDLRTSEVEVLAEQGDFESAISVLEELAASNAGDLGILALLGRTKRRSGDYSGGFEALGRAIAGWEKEVEVVRNIGEPFGWDSASIGSQMVAVRELPRYRRMEYLRAIGNAVTLGPDRWRLYFERGICAERLGDWPQAEKDLEHALELSGGDPQVANYLAYTWVDMGVNLEKGLAMLEEAVAARPHDGHIIDSVGWAKYRLGDYEGALEDLDRAVELLPNAPEVYDHLGDALWRVGRRIEAGFQWRRALDFEPEEKLRKRIEAKLEEGLEDLP